MTFDLGVFSDEIIMIYVPRGRLLERARGRTQVRRPRLLWGCDEGMVHVGLGLSAG